MHTAFRRRPSGAPPPKVLPGTAEYCPGTAGWRTGCARALRPRAVGQPLCGSAHPLAEAHLDGGLLCTSERASACADAPKCVTFASFSLYDAVEYDAVDYDAVDYNAVDYDAVEYNTVDYNAPR